MMVFLIMLLGSMFVWSFSSVVSALILILCSFSLLGLMYWNLIGMVPLYLFSLFMVGGLFVLIGFVMMADSRDLDMILSMENMGEWMIGFFSLTIVMILIDKMNCDLDWLEDSFLKMNSWESNELFCCIYIFLMLLLFVFLFVMYVMMKGSVGGGGFVKFS